jgi:hypothetical protein
MASMFDTATRERFQTRIGALRPDAERQWGRMNASQMVCHLADQLRVALGQIPTRPIRGLLRYPPFKQLVVDVLPWPKGRVQAPPEAFTTAPGVWERDVAVLRQLLDQFAAREGQRQWPPHPKFGKMSGGLWSRLTCRHFDHHLRQFGQ